MKYISFLKAKNVISCRVYLTTISKFSLLTCFIEFSLKSMYPHSFIVNFAKYNKYRASLPGHEAYLLAHLMTILCGINYPFSLYM